jgi:hypothetical protein
MVYLQGDFFEESSFAGYEKQSASTVLCSCQYPYQETLAQKIRDEKTLKEWGAA